MAKQFRKQYNFWDAIDVFCWVTLFGSWYITDFTYHLHIPSLYLIARGFIRRSQIKTDLKNAVDYCRVRRSTKLLLQDFLFFTGFMTAVFVGVSFLEPYLPNFEIFDVAHLVFTQFIYGLLIVRLQNFTSGVRWYVSGIKLPGERSLLIPWRHISKVKADNGFIYITALGKDYKFDIHPKDYRSALHFQRWYEKKTSALED